MANSISNSGSSLFVSPAEPKELRVLGTVSTVPETYGADFLWRAHGMWWGVQRKELKDLLASLQDGRLSKEVMQMRAGLSEAMLVVEGPVTFTTEGRLMTRGGWGKDWTQEQWDGLMFSIMHEGVKVMRSGGMKETARLIKEYKAWSEKEKHGSLKVRPGPQVKWGRPGNKDYQIHLMMGLPGVGWELAKRMVEMFGGVPWKWTVGVEELMQVEGVGRKKAEMMLECMNQTFEIGGDLSSIQEKHKY